ncbi:acyl-CoA carboxylase subunit epsilon [Actinopolymorpha pittospori]
MAGEPNAAAGERPDVTTSEPLLRVVRGNPTPAEFAALVAVISAKQRAAAAARDQGGQRDRRGGEPGWAAYWRRSRQPLRPGPGAWRASALPR